MEKACKILRRSIYTFFQGYQYFALTAAFLAFPFSLSVLSSQAFTPSSSSSLHTIYNRLHTIFDAAGFPSSSGFFYFLNVKLSQIISCSIFTYPFTLTFLLFAKASVIQVFKHEKRTIPSSFSCFISTYKPLVTTYACNSLIILSANATAFALLFLLFNSLEGFGLTSAKKLFFLSAIGAVLYSIILANVLMVCNLALVISGMEKLEDYMSILKASILIRGRASLALSLVIPVNIVLTASEALFQYRIVRDFQVSRRPFSSMTVEGILIAYLYSILLVLDTIVSCLFYKSCKTDYLEDQKGLYYQIEVIEDNGCTIARLKRLEVLLEIAV